MITTIKHHLQSVDTVLWTNKIGEYLKYQYHRCLKEQPKYTQGATILRTCTIDVLKNSPKIPKEQSEAANRQRTDNLMAKRKRRIWQTMNSSKNYSCYYIIFNSGGFIMNYSIVMVKMIITCCSLKACHGDRTPDLPHWGVRMITIRAFSFQSVYVHCIRQSGT